MADLIDRAAVLAEIGEFQIRFNETGDSHERVAYASAEHCMLVIKAAPAVNRWISVEDALPDGNRSVLVQYNEMYADGIHKQYAVAFYGKYTHHWIEPCSGQILNVTKWQELDI